MWASGLRPDPGTQNRHLPVHHRISAFARACTQISIRLEIKRPDGVVLGHSKIYLQPDSRLRLLSYLELTSR